ncbi:MAG: protein kinase [Gammaproteobacteria bacterium]|nr:protein kinase [Gammaproteobacteria bacterium]
MLESGMANAHRNSLPPGHQLLWYEITSILGQGGFGITYLAHDMNLKRDVAIKEYLPVEIAVRDASFTVQPLSEDYSERYQWGLKRFIAEARTLTKFNHPGIVRVDSVFEENNSGYMVMQYEDGESLQDRLKGAKTLDAATLEKIVPPLLDGLEQIHRMGFIHRDIKPDNIYLRKDGSPVLLDFGSARQALGEQTKTLTSLVTPGFAPFEQYYSKSDEQGAFSDIYGLGATLYRAVTGIIPLDAIERSKALLRGSLDTCVPAYEIAKDNYPEHLLKAIDHAIQFKAEDRPQTIEEWRGDFDGTTEWAPAEAAPEVNSTFLNITEKVEAIEEIDVKEEAPVEPVPEENTPPAPVDKKPGSSLWGIVGLILLIAFALGAYQAWLWFERETQIQYPPSSVEKPVNIDKEQVDLDAKREEERLEAERLERIKQQEEEEQALEEEEEKERLALEAKLEAERLDKLEKEKAEEQARLKEEALEREKQEQAALEKEKETERVRLEKEATEKAAEAERIAALERERLEEEKAKKALSMSTSVYEKLKEARSLIAIEQYEQGLSALRALEKQDGLSPYEKAQINYSLGFALTITNDDDAAIRAYETVLQQENLPASLAGNTLFALAEIQYDRTEYRESIGSLKQAYNLVRENGENPTENLLLLMGDNYRQLADNDNLLNINRRLVRLYPNKEHWLALAEAHAKLGQHEDQLFIMEQLSENGELSTEQELVSLANVHVLHGDAVRAVEILESGMAEGLIQKSNANIILLSKAQKLVQ